VGGYVGIGTVTQEAVMARDFRVDGKRLDQLELLRPRILENADDLDKAEYPVRVDWAVAVDGKDGKWSKNRKLFTHRQAKASLQKQSKNLEFIVAQFGIKPFDLMKELQLRLA